MRRQSLLDINTSQREEQRAEQRRDSLSEGILLIFFDIKKKEEKKGEGTKDKKTKRQKDKKTKINAPRITSQLISASVSFFFIWQPVPTGRPSVTSTVKLHVLAAFTSRLSTTREYPCTNTVLPSRMNCDPTLAILSRELMYNWTNFSARSTMAERRVSKSDAMRVATRVT